MSNKAAAELARLRWASMSEREIREHQAKAAKARWDRFTKEQRSAEMKRRRRKGLAK